jgi:hypothetical protein
MLTAPFDPSAQLRTGSNHSSSMSNVDSGAEEAILMIVQGWNQGDTESLFSGRRICQPHRIRGQAGMR